MSQVTKEMMGAAGAAFHAAVIRNETMQEALRKAVEAAFFMKEKSEQENLASGGMYKCRAHGGYGFASDCKVCKEIRGES